MSRPSSRPVLVVSILGILLAGLVSSPARADTTSTIGFDDQVGVIGGRYNVDANPLKRVLFTDQTVSQADADAASPPNDARLTYFPPPASGLAGQGFGFGHSGAAFEFPFTHASVAMNVGYEGSGSAPVTIRAYDVDNTLIAQSSATVAGGPATTPLSVTSFAGRISSIEVDGTGAPWVIDDLTVDVPTNPPPADFGLSWPGRSAGQVAIGADDTVDVPLGISRVNGSSGPITLAATNLPGGVTATFLPNPAGDTSTHSAVTMRLHASSLASLAPVVRQPVTVTATPAGTAGPIARQVIVPVTVLAEFNLRARGIDITQGVQTGGPGDGLPQIALGGRAYSYRGVPLVAYGYKPTIARFYADASGAPSDGAPADATLEGFASDGRPLPGSPLHPDGGGGLLIDRGPSTQVTYAERLDDLHPFDFTIPPSWQGGHITLRGHVFTQPQFAFSATDRECGQPFCLGDNTVELRDINFIQGANISVDPIKVVYDDRTQPGSPHIEPPDWYGPFQVANQLMPIHLIPHYWRGEIDVTTHKEFHGFKGWVTRSFINDNGIARNDKASEIDDLVSDFADGKADMNFPVGIIGFFNQYDGSRTDVGVTTGGPANEDRPNLVVNPQRPYTSVAHEVGHAFGRQHASGGCGGGSNGQTADDWPDPFGYLHAVGIDVTQGGADGGQYKMIGANPAAGNCSGNAPPDCGGASPAEPFDYMSYCANESDAWISAIGWTALLNRYNLGATGARAHAAKARRTFAGVKVRGFMTPEGAQVESVLRGRFPAVHGGSGSVLTLEATDAAGHGLRSAPLQILSGHTDAVGSGAPQPTMEFQGTLPAASAASVRVLQGTTVVARRDRSKHAPRVRFLSPGRGAVVGRRPTILVRWKATDADHTPVTVSLDYSRDAGRTWGRIYEGPNRGSVRLPRTFFAHARHARLRLVADDGFNQTAARSGVFRSLGAPPIVRILQPTKGIVKAQDATLLLQGLAFADTGGRLTKRSLRWLVGGRVVGHGENTSVTALAAGRRKVQFEARDGTGRVGRAIVYVRLTRVLPSFRRVAAPKRISRRAKSVTLVVGASVEVGLKIGSQHFTVSRTARNVRVKVRPGRGKLTLSLVIGTGTLSAKKTVVIARS